MRVLILISGGFDSTYLTRWAIEQGHTVGLLHIHYDHPASDRELFASSVIARDVGVELDIISVPLMAQALASGVGESGARIVYGRNAIFVAHAVSVAASGGYNEVWIGATAEDNGYPDCRPEWIRLQDQLARPWGVSIRAPIICHTRQQIAERAREKEWDMSLCWSCYQPTDAGEPCQTCNSCTQGGASE